MPPFKKVAVWCCKLVPENSQTRKAFLPNKGRYGKTIGKMAGLFRILKA